MLRARWRRFWGIAGLIACAGAVAQAAVYRCGDVYTNQAIAGQQCHVLVGGQISVVGSTPRSQPSPARAQAQSPSLAASRPEPADKAEQALAVLRAELVQAQQRLSQAQAAPSSDRARAQQAQARAQADVDSLNREIARWSRR